ncbi:protein lplB [Paenibacillus ihbetae]|uniref:Protein lplB n=1 Tax=Paenibacillus ihbetae TaxID=1870820 RepID=A0A1B2E1W0_9BACL|nr:ABC transporter permease subunit [Paenibacillus ihbetae]ANY73984.1 protein lplB [Paenibacillus ihbetae]
MSQSAPKQRQVPVAPEPRIHSSSFLRRFVKQWEVQLMVIPGVILVFIFSYLPMYGVITGFMDYDLFTGSRIWENPWVGFKHFEAFFNAPEFERLIRNTLVISLLKFFIGFPAPILLALMLNEVRHMFFKRTVQTLTYLPHFLSWVIVAGLTMSMLSTENGSVNMLLKGAGLISEPINFLGMKEYFWSILISANVWKEIGFNSIVFMAAIAGIDPALYEAADIDGASKFKQIFKITLPCIMPVVIIFMILAIGNLVNAGFEDILLLATNPVLRPVSDVIDTYVYRVGLGTHRYSYAVAIGLFKAIVSVTLLTIANYLARRSGNSLW